MRRLLPLLLLLLLPALGHDAPASAPPRYPSAPPPLISGSAAPARPGQKVWKYNLQAGWNMLSFPMSSVTNVQGLRYMLVRPTAAGPVNVDPVNHPEQAETGRGYWAYSDRPATLEVSGPANAGDDPGIIILETGWNLIGCPWERPINVRDTSLGVPGGILMTLEQAIDVEPCYLFGYAYLYGAKKFTLQNLEDPGAQLKPQQATWIYARSPAQLNLNLGQAPPRLTSVVRDGDQVVATGSGLGSPATGKIFFAEHPAKGDRVISWTDKEIRAQGPAHAVSGDLVIMVNMVPSNRYPVVLGPPPVPGGPTSGGLTGQVTDDSNRAVAGAKIVLDTGASVFSDDQGSFSFSGLPPGPHSMQASEAGYGGAKGSVTVVAGKIKPVAIMLPLRRGAISVRAYPYPYGGATFVPSQILMWETGDYNHRYLRDYSYYERGWNRYDLDWSDLPMGREYSVTVTWKDENKNEQTITHRYNLDRTSYTDNFYNSWSY